MGETVSLKQKWVDALLSGQYQQCTGTLWDGNGYCCLGVLEKVAGNINFFDPEGLNYDEDNDRYFDDDGDIVDSNFIQPRGQELLVTVGMDNEIQTILSEKNDGGDSFTLIATWIEENLDDNLDRIPTYEDV